MEIYKEGIYWFFKNTRGPVPRELSGEWTSMGMAQRALEMFQQKVRSRAVNPAEDKRKREQRRLERTATESTTVATDTTEADA